MSKDDLHSLADCLSGKAVAQEVYTVDQYRRKARANKGFYSREQGAFDFIHLIKSWDKIVGPLMAKNTMPIKIRGRTLIIAAKHPIFAQELGLMAPIIIKKIGDEFFNLKNSIDKIKFLNSEGTFEQVPLAKRREKKTVQHHPFSPHYQQKKQVASHIFSEIEDEELKQIFVDLYLQKL